MSCISFTSENEISVRQWVAALVEFRCVEYGLLSVLSPRRDFIHDCSDGCIFTPKKAYIWIATFIWSAA